MGKHNSIHRPHWSQDLYSYQQLKISKLAVALRYLNRKISNLSKSLALIEQYKLFTIHLTLTSCALMLLNHYYRLHNWLIHLMQLYLLIWFS